MNHARLCAAIAVLLLLAAIANSLWNRPAAEEFAAPTYRAGKTPLLLATMPRIGEFYREFEVNKENPFVPLADRLRDYGRGGPAIAQPLPPRGGPPQPGPGPTPGIT